MTESDSGVRRLNLSHRLINVLTIVASKRYPVTTSEIISDMKMQYSDNAHHRTIFRCLESWESCGYIRRNDPASIGDPIRWVSMSRIVRKDY